MGLLEEVLIHEVTYYIAAAGKIVILTFKTIVFDRNFS